MDDFKDSTKTQYSRGGPVSGLKGAAAVAKATRAFKNGGAVSARPANAQGRRISDEELATPERILRKSGRADPYEAMPPALPVAKKRVIRPAAPEATEPQSALSQKLSVLPSQRGEMRGPSGAGFRKEPMVGFKCGGLATLPNKK